MIFGCRTRLGIAPLPPAHRKERDERGTASPYCAGILWPLTGPPAWRGFGWACIFGQALRNGFTGYGFHTDSYVENEFRKGIQSLKNQGLSAEGLDRHAVITASMITSAK